MGAGFCWGLMVSMVAKAETLDAVIAHYAAGGRKRGPLTSPFLPGFQLSADETADLKAFLESLTDRDFLGDPRFSNPWKSGPNAATSP